MDETKVCECCEMAAKPWRERTGAVLDFKCTPCCIRWLSRMTPEEMKINAPVIKYAAGEEQLNKVRLAWARRQNEGG